MTRVFVSWERKIFYSLIDNVAFITLSFRTFYSRTQKNGSINKWKIIFHETNKNKKKQRRDRNSIKTNSIHSISLSFPQAFSLHIFQFSLRAIVSGSSHFSSDLQHFMFETCFFPLSFPNTRHKNT
jgi:hypothetical protein